MKIVNENTPQDNQVIAAEQRQVRTEHLIGRMKPHPGYRVFQFDLATGEVTEAVIEQVNATLSGAIIKKATQQPHCMYCTALNKKNAIKKFIPMYARLKEGGHIVKVEMIEDKYNHTREDGERVFIDWEVGGEIDVHDSGCVDVWLTGEDQEGRKYSADGNTQDGELEDISNVEEL